MDAPAPRLPPAAMALAVVGGPLAFFAWAWAGAALALPAATDAPPTLDALGWVTLWLAPVGLVAAVLLLRRPRGLPATPLPPNVVAAVGILAMMVATGVMLLAALLLPGGPREPGGLAVVLVAELAWGAGALCAWLVLGPPAPHARRWGPGLGAAAWASLLPLANAAAVANQWLLHAAGRGAPVQPVLERYVTASACEQAITALAVVGVTPLLEESIFRGAIYRGLRDLSGPWPAALGSALLFTAVHNAAPQALPILVFGLMLAWTYERAGTLLAPITAHMLHNALALAYVG